ncbi:hypothetical protein EV426DRAFT_701079 [Tirmania nivea]|nr:hypothetical protein EV426DRAFT_701079 [Tirmania nivea]
MCVLPPGTATRPMPLEVSSHHSGQFPTESGQVLATLDALVNMFKSLYSINSDGASGVAIGRYPEDVYDGPGTSAKQSHRAAHIATTQWRMATTSPLSVPGITNNGGSSSVALQPGKIWIAPIWRKEEGQEEWDAIEAFVDYLHLPLTGRN